jgi:hypothetical protein
VCPCKKVGSSFCECGFCRRAGNKKKPHRSAPPRGAPRVALSQIWNCRDNQIASTSGSCCTVHSAAKQIQTVRLTVSRAQVIVGTAQLLGCSAQFGRAHLHQLVVNERPGKAGIPSKFKGSGLFHVRDKPVRYCKPGAREGPQERYTKSLVRVRRMDWPWRWIKPRGSNFGADGPTTYGPWRNPFSSAA